MATITERIDGRTYSSDGFGGETGTRVFQVVQCNSISAAKIAFLNTPGFLLHPDSDKLELTGYTINSEGGSALYTVEASYVRYSQFNTIDIDATYERTTVELPYISPKYVTTMTGEVNLQTGAPEMLAKLVFGWQNITIPERRLRRIVNVTWRLFDPNDAGTGYETIDYLNGLDMIAKQEGRLHVIFGGLWKFLGGTATRDQKNPGVYRIRYQWELDEGTPQPESATITYRNPNTLEQFSTPAAILPNEDLPDQAFDRLWRPAYSVPFLYSYDPERRPIYRPVFTAGIDEFGWKDLPGMPTT